MPWGVFSAEKTEIQSNLPVVENDLCVVVDHLLAQVVVSFWDLSARYGGLELPLHYGVSYKKRTF